MTRDYNTVDAEFKIDADTNEKGMTKRGTAHKVSSSVKIIFVKGSINDGREFSQFSDVFQRLRESYRTRASISRLDEQPSQNEKVLTSTYSFGIPFITK